MYSSNNTDCDYYIKEVENKAKNIFVVPKNIPLNEKIIKEMEKSNCKIIEFGIKFNQSICYNLPSVIEKIVFIEKFNKFNQSANNLPKELKKITFGYNFNQSVDNLPTGLLRLTFGCNFNQPVDNLPTGLQRLTFGYNFNQLVDNLPTGLQRLILSETYNKPLNNLPTSVKIIRIKYY
jgi:hypothetical protein